MTATLTEYKGHPIINLPNGNRDFSFGLAKAKTILEHIEDIRRFVEDDTPTASSSKPTKEAPKGNGKGKATVGPFGIEIGDIFVDEWGYEQTNVDFYQVVKATAKTVTVRQVEQDSTETTFPASDIRTMSGYTTPIKGRFAGSERVKHPYEWEGRVYIKSQYGSSKLWDGKPQGWTGYA